MLPSSRSAWLKSHGPQNCTRDGSSKVTATSKLSQSLNHSVRRIARSGTCFVHASPLELTCSPFAGSRQCRNDRLSAERQKSQWCLVDGLVTSSDALVPSSLLFLIANIVTTSKALLTSSDALVPSSKHCHY